MTASRRQLVLAAAALGVAFALAFAALASAASILEQPVASAAPATGTALPAQLTQESPTTPPSATSVVLSNERTATTWAHPVEEVSIREQSAATSRTIARTHLETEDGFPEVYLLLSSFTDARGRVWVRVRIPGRPNGRIGWVPGSALGDFHVSHWLVDISLSGRRLRAYYKDKLRLTAPVGVGKPSTPTPPGRFWIRETFKLTSRSSPYWPYAIGTSDYSTLTDWPGGGVVGIHGDFGEPQLIPGDPSHGCVRMHDADIAWLATRVQLGTPVHVIR
jgi:lipoprotein-anchoring transpeptidase ErfK/SrfK